MVPNVRLCRVNSICDPAMRVYFIERALVISPKKSYLFVQTPIP